jgi:cytochrome c oxidase subunit 3
MIAAHEHRYRSAMWIFLASEALLFAGLFALYTAYRDQYPDDFMAGVDKTVGWMGATNTLLLVISSFFVAFAIHLTRAGRTRAAIVSLVPVLLLGGAFLVLKLVEWKMHVDEGLTAGAGYHSTELPGHGAALFFTLYYLMTGLHAFHLVLGLAVIAWMIAWLRSGRITRQHHLVLELGGLYWHFVDVIWLFLWPLFYLVR